MQPGHPTARTVRRLGAGGHERQHPRAATSVRQERAYAGCALRGCEREAIRRASELTFYRRSEPDERSRPPGYPHRHGRVADITARITLLVLGDGHQGANGSMFFPMHTSSTFLRNSAGWQFAYLERSNPAFGNVLDGVSLAEPERAIWPRLPELT